ncbi:hypothetical protein [Streptomyces sp. NPDC001020]
MSATARSDSTVARGVLERLVRPVWNSLVIYGAMWLPVDENNPIVQHYRFAGRPAARPVTPLTPITPLKPVARSGGSEGNESGRTTLSAS